MIKNHPCINEPPRSRALRRLDDVRESLKALLKDSEEGEISRRTIGNALSAIYNECDKLTTDIRALSSK